MKTLVYTGVLIVMICTSCTKKFLDVDNTQQLYRETYVKDLTTLREYMRGVYYLYSSSVESGEAAGAYADVVADNIRPMTLTSSNATISHYNWVQESVPSALRNMNALWRNGYNTIRNASFVVQKAAEYAAEDATVAGVLKGEALALRALIHWRLVCVFAQPHAFTADGSHIGIPYITTYDFTQAYHRNTVAEVYNSMIDDLNEAINLLPAISTDTRQMNKRAAKALLARVYLYKGDYTNAKRWAAEVATEAPLMTIANGYPNDMFKLKNATATESLFQLTPFTQNAWGRFLRRSPITHVSTNDLGLIITESSTDVRRTWVFDTIVANVHHLLIKKFPANVAPEIPGQTTTEAAYYTPVLRSSEMFLTAAEAAAHTNDESGARTYLNAVRKRADPSRPDVTATGTALLDSIEKERRKELSFEGYRMFDLLRLKKGVTRIDVLPGVPTSLPYPNHKAIAPLPYDEVSIGKLKQNESY